MDRVDGYVAELEYVAGFYPEMGPASLNFALLMQGIEPLPLQHGFTYCDLGCGQGVSLNLFAACHPEGAFHAVDFNQAHIVGARAAADHARLANASFWEAKFADLLELPLPEFDFITLHGVYSWVNAENRQYILEFLKRKLKVGGVVYISYNCIPGWSAFAPVRQLLVSYADTQPGHLEEKINRSLEFVDRLKALNLSYFTTNPTIAGFFDYISKFPRNYLAHEFYNRDWTLFYHADVAAELAGAGLTLAGSANFADNLDFLRFPTEVQQLVNEISDPVLRETVKDLASNQRFRKDVFVRQRPVLSLPRQLERMRRSRFALVDPQAKVELKANFPRGEAKYTRELYQPVLHALEERPHSLDDLLQRPDIALLGEDKLLQVLMVLLAGKHVMPTTDPTASALASTKLFNYSVLDRKAGSGELQYLASPLTRNAVSLTHLQRMLLLCDITHSGDPFSFIQRVTADSRDIPASELRQQIDQFHNNYLPILRQLQVA